MLLKYVYEKNKSWNTSGLEIHTVSILNYITLLQKKVFLFFLGYFKDLSFSKGGSLPRFS